MRSFWFFWILTFTSSTLSLCPAVYFASQSPSKIGIINPTSPYGVVGTITTSGLPNFVRAHPSGLYLYVTFYSSNGIAIISTSSNTVLSTFTVTGQGSNGIGDMAISQDGTIAFVSGTGTNNIYQLNITDNGATLTQAQTIATGQSPSTHVGSTYSLTITGDNVFLIWTSTTYLNFMNISTYTNVNSIPLTNSWYPRTVFGSTYSSGVYVTINSTIFFYHYNSNTSLGNISLPGSIIWEMEIQYNNQQIFASTDDSDGSGEFVNIPALTLSNTVSTGTLSDTNSGVAVMGDNSIAVYSNGHLNPQQITLVNISTEAIITTITTGTGVPSGFPGGVATITCSSEEPCQPGSYLVNPNVAGVCGICPPGSFSNTPNANTCTDCPVGTYASASNSTLCQNCSAGSYAPIARSTQCRDCARGSAVNITGQSFCSVCNPGTDAVDIGQENCDLCPLGTSTNGEDGSTGCSACSAGTYANVTGLPVCATCPVGYRTTDDQTCSPCPIGSENPFTGKDYCSTCSCGTYQNQTGGVTCTICSAGFYTPNTSACISCPVGYVAPISGSCKCSPCGEGFYTTDFINCLACPVNTSTSIGMGIYTCTINCTLILVGDAPMISSGVGGPCFEPVALGLSGTILAPCLPKCAPPIWAYVLVSVLGVLLIIMIVLLIVTTQSTVVYDVDERVKKS